MEFQLMGTDLTNEPLMPVATSLEEPAEELRSPFLVALGERVRMLRSRRKSVV